MQGVEPESLASRESARRWSLVDLFDTVVAEGRPLWVSLEAQSGCGKTRVVREFYKRLAARQEEPRYWPATIINPDDPSLGGIKGIAYRRKRVYPMGQVRPADSLPEFLW